MNDTSNNVDTHVESQKNDENLLWIKKKNKTKFNAEKCGTDE